MLSFRGGTLVFTHQRGDLRGERHSSHLNVQFGKNQLILLLHKMYHTPSHFIVLLFWLFWEGALLFKNFKSMFNVLYSFLCDFFFFSLLFKLKVFVSLFANQLQ